MTSNTFPDPPQEKEHPLGSTDAAKGGAKSAEGKPALEAQRPDSHQQQEPASAEAEGEKAPAGTKNATAAGTTQALVVPADGAAASAQHTEDAADDAAGTVVT